MTTQRVLPADVYDALELSALVFGGIGAGAMWEDDAPRCIYGHGLFLDCDTDNNGNARGEVWKSLSDTGLSMSENDMAVNSLVRGTTRRRITFEEWSLALGIVRREL